MSPHMCSTPFGVTDLVTVSNLVNFGRDAMCSTPFGVTDLVTPGLLVDLFAVFRAQRLSASQTWSQEYCLHHRFQEFCAQRLSASQTWSRFRASRSPAKSRECAQRLSASQTWSPP